MSQNKKDDVTEQAVDTGDSRRDGNFIVIRQPACRLDDHEIRVPMASDDDPLYRLPPIKREFVYVGLSQTMDWGLELFGIPSVWKISRGANVKVAILDSGIDHTHPDLESAILDTADFTNSKSGPYDVNGHGTHVAGIVAARDNQFGVVGVAPECCLLIAKVLSDFGSGTGQSIADAVYWALDKGAQVISMSLGSSRPSPEMYEAIKLATRKGVLVVCAAGNEGPSMDTVSFPARFPEVVAVGAIDRQKQIARYSSRGRQVDIVAPGDDILSTYPPRGYAKLSGSSMACPYVAGTAALMLAATDHALSQEEFLRRIIETAVDAGPTGFDPNFGYGLINPAALLGLTITANKLSICLKDLTPEAQIQVLSVLKSLRYDGTLLVDGQDLPFVLDLEARH